MAELDVRSLVESAYNEAEAAGGESPEAVASDVAVGDTGMEEAAPALAEASSDAGGSEPVQTKAERSRDEKGKFAPKPKEGQALKPASSKTAAVAEGASGSSPTSDGSQLSAPPAPAEAVRAPQSLTPAERELFAKAPPELQKALARIDQTVRQQMQESAPARKLQQEFSQAVAPFEGMLRNSGFANPLQAVQAAFTTIQQLQTGSPKARAQILHGLMQTYETDVEALDGLLSQQGQPQTQQPAHIDPDAIARTVEERVNQRWMQQRQQQNEAQISKDLEAFTADPKTEFYEDVAPVMAALIRAVPQGQKVDIKEVYEQAVWSRADLRDIMQKRANQIAGKAATASTQQARIAASSVKSTPSTGASSIRAPKTDKERVEAAWEALDR